MKNLDTMLLHNLLHANEGTNKLMLQNTRFELRISTYAGVTQRLECLPSNYLKAIQHLLIVVKRIQDTIQKKLMIFSGIHSDTTAHATA